MHYSPLRYPGGKGKLAPFIAKVLDHNNLFDSTYIEPYAGGASVGLFLLIEGHIRRIVINDLDFTVYAFWWAILNDTDRFCELLINTPITMDTWNIQRDVFLSKCEKDLTALGFATFFLNRTNRSGVLRGGVIGGKRQDGPYKINARFNKKALLERIKLIAQFKNKILLFNDDAIDLLTKVSSNKFENSILYLDPPYFKKGKLLYKNSYEASDHCEVAKSIKSFSVPWLVTYDNTPEIIELYQNEQTVSFDISYSAHTARPRGQEVMFYKNLQLPCAPYTRQADMPL